MQKILQAAETLLQARIVTSIRQKALYLHSYLACEIVDWLSIASLRVDKIITVIVAGPVAAILYLSNRKRQKNSDPAIAFEFFL